VIVRAGLAECAKAGVPASIVSVLVPMTANVFSAWLSFILPLDGCVWILFSFRVILPANS
jgi:hypothetical protein